MQIESIVQEPPIRSIRIVKPLEKKSEDENQIMRNFELCRKGETNTLFPKDLFILYRWIENIKTMINPVYAKSNWDICA